MRLDRSAGWPRRRRESGLARRLSAPAGAALEVDAGANLREITRRLRLRGGYRVLLEGSAGSAGAHAARWLGAEAGRPVYRVDLGQVISKYIGETEKNLGALLQAAERKRWILFFDEADALFGKRSDVKDAHDRYANQEVAYLLRRLQDYDGPLVFATARRGNLDDAFLRRFQAVLHVSPPADGCRDAGC